MAEDEKRREVTMEVRGMWKKIAMGLVAAGLSMVLLLAGAIPVCEAGPDERVVKIGLCTCWTGALASHAVPWGNGLLDYLRYVNEQGGINGIKVEMPWYDTRTVAPQAVPAFRRPIEEGAIILQDVTECGFEAAIPVARRADLAVITLTALTPGMITKPQRIVTTFSDWPTAFMTVVKWIKGNLWTEARNMRVGTIFYDTLAGYGTLEATKYFEKIGVEFVGYEVVPFIGCIDTSTELLRLASKADWIYVTAYGASMTTIGKDAARLGLQEKGICFAASPLSLDEASLRILGHAVDGWYANALHPMPWESEKFPGLKVLTEKAKEYRGMELEDTGGFYTTGWVHQAAAVEAIRLAIEKVGYENLTRRAVREALFSIRNFETGGWAPPITISEDTPWLMYTVQVRQVREAKFCPIGWADPLPGFYKTPEEFERALEK